MSEPGSNASGEPTRKRPRRWLRILKRVVITLLIVVAVLVFGVFPYWFSSVVTNAGTRPMDRQLTSTPADFGAQFEDVEFHTSDGVRISGWLLPSRDKHTTIVYSHGLFRSRRELLERAIDLWKLGYGALVCDARSHGESGKARVSMGYWERLDAEAAVKFLREEVRTQDRIVLFGISMGAAAALLAAAETPDVAAVIADSSFLSLDDTIDHHVRLFLRLPAFPMANEFKFFLERKAGFDASKLDALDAVRRIGDRPILFIAAANDRRMPPEIARTLFNACASSKKDLLVVDGPGSEIHAHAYQARPRVYIERVAQFLDSTLSH
ncbi:MAG: alpha/beta hydrolase [Blastocatellia bacterium]